MTRSRLMHWILCCLAVAAVGVAGCSTDTTTSGESTGSLDLNLELAPGVVINEVKWVISRPLMEDMMGTIDTSAPGATASVEVFGLPPGDGYTVTLTAMVEGEDTACGGSADFSVEVGVSTPVMVMLNCKRPETLGGVRVNGKFNICAELAKVIVSPLRTSVGNEIDLSALAVDVDDDQEDIRYRWIATGGSIADPNDRITTYTCEEVGVNHTIVIQVSDDEGEFGEFCMDDWDVDVTCVLGDEPDCEIDDDCDLGEVCENNICVPDVDCEDDNDCDALEICNDDNECEAVQCKTDDNCDLGLICSDDNICVPDVDCNEDDECGVDEVCVANTCVGDPDLFCNENLCEIDDAARADCIDTFVTCIVAEPANEEECILLARLQCNECNEDSDCDTGEVCNDNKVCVPMGEIPLPMVVDDHYFDRSGFSNGPGGEPLHTEDNDCPERAGGENGQCHRFIWDGMDGAFTGTFWTDGEGFVDLNGLPVQSGATEVQFYAWGAVGGEAITFGAGIGDAELDGAEARRLITLTTAPTLYTVSLAALAGYTDVYGPFIWAADTGGNPSGFEFYVDDIQWIQGGGGGPGCSDAIDFEDACGPYTFSDFEGGVATVIDNPDPSGINTTAKVAQMQKFAGAVFGGSTLALDSAVDWTKGTAFTMKVWSPREVPVLFKLEGLNQESSDIQTGSSSWEELCYDFAGRTDGAPATAITFIFDLGNEGDAGGDPDNWTFFFDGITQTDSCGGGGGGELTTNGDFETGALNIDDDPANGWTLFCDGANVSCEATMDEANGGVWSGHLVAQGGIGDAVIKNANIGIGTVEPNSPISVSVDIKGTTADGGVVFVQFFSELCGGGVSKEEFVGGGAIFPTDTWQTFTLDTTTGPDVCGGVTLQLKSACGAATTCIGDAFFDNASVSIP